nr:farnesoic acid O-methyltransferase isoform A [Pyrrhocoris apterus]
MGIDVETDNSMEYRFYPTQTQALKFSVRAPHDAHIAITPAPVEANPMYEIFIGGWNNSKCAIRRNREKPDVAEHSSSNILNGNEYRSFWITCYENVIALGAEGDCTPLLVWSDPNLFNVTHFGVRTSWGATGSWRIDDTFSGWRGVQSPTSAIGWRVDGMVGDGMWLSDSGGRVPPNAVKGGFDNEQLYIGRAHFKGTLTPGKIHPSHGVCYVPWGGEEHACPEYEVLCDCRGVWVKATGVNVPPNAIKGGVTEDGEPLYIGRAVHNSTMTVGKVQKSHGKCYIPYAGGEIGTENYEVLVLE